MSWAEDRRADRIADREEDRKDRREREEASRRRREEDDERQRRERAEKRREKGQKKAARRARTAKARQAIAANLDTSLAILAMGCSIGPALFYQIKAMLGAGAPLLIALAMAIMLESGAQVATITGEKAKREGRPVGPHRIAMWGCATIAAGINAAKAPSMFPDASWMVAVLALSSYGGVAFWELRGLGRHQRGKSARTKQQRAEDKARREHEQKRRAMKPVWARYEEILAAHPYGTVAAEEAWAQAWLDVKGAPLGMTADVIGRRLKATADVEKALTDSAAAAVATGAELFLADLASGRNGGDDGTGGTPLHAPSGKPPKGDPQAATALGGKGKQATRAAARSDEERPLEVADLERVRALADALGDARKLSAKNVQQTVGCRNKYALRLRDAVKEERGVL
jgi:hypothetical protein